MRNDECRFKAQNPNDPSCRVGALHRSFVICAFEIESSFVLRHLAVLLRFQQSAEAVEQQCTQGLLDELRRVELRDELRPVTCAGNHEVNPDAEDTCHVIGLDARPVLPQQFDDIGGVYSLGREAYLDSISDS